MPPATPPGNSGAQTFIRESARLNESDRYISALLAPRAARDDLITLAAYLGEVRRIALTVSETALGEIRLQWWRDVLSAGAQVWPCISGLIDRYSVPSLLLSFTLPSRSFLRPASRMPGMA